MGKIHKLYNQIKHYEWGSPDLIPGFLDIKNPGGLPYAEMWMGTHAGAPSCADYNGNKILLKDICGDLPFLFKLLAVDKPLSIQAHPNLEKAREGFELEEQAGLERNSPVRNYKDPNQKSELLCALSRFTLMAGFRDKEAINKTLNDLLICLPQLKEIITPLQRSLNTESLAVFFRILNGFSDFEKEYISSLIKENDFSVKCESLTQDKISLLKKFASLYPLDSAILSPVYLNLITLQPQQAIYIPAGVLHSYLSGFGVELMTACDNVLRGGLTPKHVNIPELMNIIDFKPFTPDIFSPAFLSWYCYGSENFSLAIMNNDGGEKTYQGELPAICLVTQGQMDVNGVFFNKGDSFFLAKDNENIVFNGGFSAFFAY